MLTRRQAIPAVAALPGPLHPGSHAPAIGKLAAEFRDTAVLFGPSA